jgi:hypothetical protein
MWHASLDTHKQCDLVFHNTNKDYLYIDVASRFVGDLNLILSICMGLSFGKVAKGWASIVGD